MQDRSRPQLNRNYRISIRGVNSPKSACPLCVGSHLRPPIPTCRKTCRTVYIWHNNKKVLLFCRNRLNCSILSLFNKSLNSISLRLHEVVVAQPSTFFQRPSSLEDFLQCNVSFSQTNLCSGHKASNDSGCA